MNLISTVKKTVVEVVNILEPRDIIKQIYVFGSVIYTDTPKDIDLIFVYFDDRIKDVYSIKRKLIEYLERKLGIQVDTLFFSETEINTNDILVKYIVKQIY